MVEIYRCPSCGELVQQSGPCDVCFQATWLEWKAAQVLGRKPKHQIHPRHWNEIGMGRDGTCPDLSKYGIPLGDEIEFTQDADPCPVCEYEKARKAFE